MGTTLHTEKDDYLHHSELISGSFELIMLYMLFFVYSEKTDVIKTKENIYIGGVRLTR
ncbi:hypothetical protein I33_2701 [Bacillus subtilis subsp. subtilis str. RO-NN-1]|nr:hypothetical protein I33_2701 [Bacillus subtilis subsp. subtilis str. RO-NN-1]